MVYFKEVFLARVKSNFTLKIFRTRFQIINLTQELLNVCFKDDSYDSLDYFKKSASTVSFHN